MGIHTGAGGDNCMRISEPKQPQIVLINRADGVISIALMLN